MKRYLILAVFALLFVVIVILSADRERRTRAEQQRVVITSNGTVVAPSSFQWGTVVATLPGATNTPAPPPAK